MAAKDKANTKGKGAVQKSSVMVHDPLADLDAGGVEQEYVAGMSDMAQPSEQDSSDSGVVALGSALTIADVTEWREKITVVFDLTEPIRLEGGEIDQVDGAGIQFLVAVMQEAVSKGIEVSWVGVSEVLQNAAEQLGLSDVLHLGNME